MTPEERIDFVFNTISGIHEPCGMPHGPDSGCTKEALKAHIKAAVTEAYLDCQKIVAGYRLESSRLDHDLQAIAKLIYEKGKCQT